LTLQGGKFKQWQSPGGLDGSPKTLVILQPAGAIRRIILILGCPWVISDPSAEHRQALIIGPRQSPVFVPTVEGASFGSCQAGGGCAIPADLTQQRAQPGKPYSLQPSQLKKAHRRNLQRFIPRMYHFIRQWAYKQRAGPLV